MSHGVRTRAAGWVVASTVSSVLCGRGGEGGRLAWGGEDKPLKVETGDQLHSSDSLLLCC